tara:strand:+ start:707 stop:2464 length:1758 start_codon:yes stop_codon:yes gene_type:complete
MDIKLITLSSYTRPAVQEDKSNDWVLNGKDNSFYEYIIKRNNGSPTNSSINKSYVTLAYGRGLGFTNNISDTVVNDWAMLQSILRPRDLKKMIQDAQIFGEFSFQVIKNKDGSLNSLQHLPKQMVVPSLEDEDGDITSYWYSRSWKDRRKEKYFPENFPAFGISDTKQTEIYVGKEYKAGNEFFGTPDYMAGLQYAQMEEEISNMAISSIQNGLSAGYIINIPNGDSYSDEEKAQFEAQVKKKLTSSSNASNFIISFNGLDVEISVTPFPVNANIHKQWDFLTIEAKSQIMTAHRVISPSLVGLSSASGFANEADMMDMAEKQLMKRVIAPKQQFVLEAIEEVLTQFDINLDLIFKPITQEEEMVKEETDSKEDNVQETDLKMASEGCNEGCDVLVSMADELIQMGEVTNEDEWELLCSSEVDYDSDDDLRGFLTLAADPNTGTARPNAKSSQDSEAVRIRYRYVGNPSPEREFCKKMMKANKLYRKEDILQMEKSSTNPNFGKGEGGDAPYSIWLWKGGGKMSKNFPNGTCKHQWQREIYLNKGKTDAKSPLAKTISTSEAKRKGYKVPSNKSDVSIKPHNNKS